MFLDDVDMYFGADRIQLLRKAMERKRENCRARRERPAGRLIRYIQNVHNFLPFADTRVAVE